jgi:hypothetical protein
MFNMVQSGAVVYATGLAALLLVGVGCGPMIGGILLIAKF